MTQSAGRIRCPQCGASNFDSVAMCYKCGSPLRQASGGAARPTGNAPVGASGANVAPYSGERPGLPMNAPPTPMMAAPPPYYAAGGGGDPGVARRAAILLALTFPFFGLPIGWAFMMIEDQRRQAIGRLCVTWSLIALIFHLLLTVVAMQSLGGYLQLALQMTKAAQSRSQGAGGGSDIPGMPTQ